MEGPVVRVIADIRGRYREVITLKDMAQTACLSPFHFSRVFRQTTGVSPGRFLSAVRIQEAQRLLRTTSLKVVDVSCEVGYGSTGTFTTRFTRSVGMSPTRFRDLGCRGLAGQVQEIVSRARPVLDGRDWGAVRGRVVMPEARPGHKVFLGAFASPITEGMPVACLRFDSAQAVDFELTSLPSGTWYIQAITVPVTYSAVQDQAVHLPAVAVSAPVRIEAGAVAAEVCLRVRARCLTDPPILLALPGLNLPDGTDIAQVAV